MAQLPDGNGSAYKLLRDRVDTALTLDIESPAVEFKEGAPWSELQVALVKTVLAMSNLRGGGLIVIGRAAASGRPEGVSHADLATYDPDVMHDEFDEYASPRAIVSMARLTLNNKDYIAIEVSEFEELPVVCRKPREPKLRRGGLYVRPLSGRPKSTIASTADDLRPVFDLAVDKGIEAFEINAARRGYVVSPTDSNEYQAEREDLGDE